jgi:DNA-binding response OmpR family regulator
MPRFDLIQIDIDRFALGTEHVIDSSKSRLLLVQSEPVLAELTQFRLELLGYQIEMVASGGEATAAIEKAPHDLVIVDTALPDGDGIEWIAQTRGSQPADQLPIIVFSLDPSLETVERAFHAGANDYLITPFDPTVMEEKIESILTQQSSLARN